ncbi:MAG: SIMPL domain-containing protein [Deferribacteres bacterium]|nr:SIMPL domain-containing protein [Deferribacteres bacterium]
MRFKLAVVGVIALLLLSPAYAAADDTENLIKVGGESRLVVRPDIAHCFLKITGEGESYEISSKAAKDKISEMLGVLKTVMGETPEISVLQVENKPKGKSFEDIYQKDFITGMAKAIKGEEIPETKSPVRKKKLTVMTVYFSLTKFSAEKILQMMNILAEKEIAFDKEGLFDLPFEFDLKRSAIFYGLVDPDKYFETLATDVYRKARTKAEIIAKAANRRLGKLVNITGGCGDRLQGSVTLSGRSDLTGKDLGPLSADPSRLVISFSKNFEFKLK